MVHATRQPFPENNTFYQEEKKMTKPQNDFSSESDYYNWIDDYVFSTRFLFYKLFINFYKQRQAEICQFSKPISENFEN